MPVPTNVTITSDIVIKKPLGEFMYANTFLSTITPKSELFGDTQISSTATGKTVGFVKPARAIAHGGRGISSAGFDPKAIVEEEFSLTVDSYRGIHTSIETKDEATEFSDDLQGQVLNPFSKNLASYVESDALQEFSKLSEVIIGSGTGGIVTFDDTVDGLSILKENGIGERDITCLASQRVHGGIVKSEATMFNNQQAISDMKYKGFVNHTAGQDWAVSEFIPNYVSGTAADGAFDSATGKRPLGTVTLTAVNGVNTLAIEGIGTDGTITEGSVIYVAGVNAVNEETRDNLGRLKGYSVTSTVTSSANAVTVTLGDYFCDDSDVNKSNTLQNVSALPVTGAIVYIAGDVDSTYKQAGSYCSETFCYAFISLTKPKGGAMYAQDNIEGAKIRVVSDYNNDLDANTYRLDNYGGYGTPRGEWGVKYWQKILA